MQVIPGPSFTKLFRHTKFVNAMKKHSAANFVKQIYVVNSFMKLASDHTCLTVLYKIPSALLKKLRIHVQFFSMFRSTSELFRWPGWQSIIFTKASVLDRYSIIYLEFRNKIIPTKWSSVRPKFTCCFDVVARFLKGHWSGLHNRQQLKHTSTYHTVILSP